MKPTVLGRLLVVILVVAYSPQRLTPLLRLYYNQLVEAGTVS